MFGRKKESATITDKDPVFEARYLGSVETYSYSGKGCTLIPVQKLWENSQAEKHLKKVTVIISTTGITLKEHKKEEGRKFAIENITFCNADKTASERVFCWIWKVPGVNRLECHAVLCRSRETAHAMAIVLSRAFQVAYKDWRANRGKQIRQKKSSQFQEIHRRLSNGGEEPCQENSTTGCQDSTQGNNASERAPCCKNNELFIHNSTTEKRRASTASSTSGFAASVILDPDEEERLEGDPHVQAILRGEVREGSPGSD